MSDEIEFNRVPYGDENKAENLFRDYLDQLIASLDVAHVRSSCARERAILKIVRGAFDAPGPVNVVRIRLAEVFDRLAEVFGWRGDEAELLATWMGLCPSIRHDITTADWQARDREAMELLHSDPYCRHAAFWKQCEDQGFDSFMRFWGHHADPFTALIALIDEAAKALGDE